MADPGFLPAAHLAPEVLGVGCLGSFAKMALGCAQKDGSGPLFPLAGLLLSGYFSDITFPVSQRFPQLGYVRVYARMCVYACVFL